MKLSPITWERWHHRLRFETVLLCSWTAPGRLFHNQSTVSDYRLWRTQSRPWGQKGRLHWHYHAQQDCTKTTDSLIAEAWKLMRLSHVAVCKPEPTNLRQVRFWFHLIKKKKKKVKVSFCPVFFLTVLVCLTVFVLEAVLHCVLQRPFLQKTSMWTRWTLRGSIIFLAMK